MCTRRVALMAVALLFGSIAFFSLLVAPVAFTSLDVVMAGRFVRGMFPWYHLEIIIVCAIAKPLIGPQWVHEIQRDGYRVSAYVENGVVAIRTRDGHDWTIRFPAIAAGVARRRSPRP